MKVGDALEAERQRRQMSQEEAGRELGRSQSAFFRYTSGGTVPLALAPAVARFLDIPLAEARTMVLETHEATEQGAGRRARRQTVPERLDALEDAVAALSAGVAELLDTPRRSGRRSPDGRSSATR